jgi:hypothetical protein
MELSSNTGIGGIIELLRQTFRRLEATADFRQDDPAVIYLKRHIIQAVAELEVSKGSAFGAEPDKTDIILS